MFLEKIGEVCPTRRRGNLSLDFSGGLETSFVSLDRRQRLILAQAGLLRIDMFGFDQNPLDEDEVAESGRRPSGAAS